MEGLLPGQLSNSSQLHHWHHKLPATGLTLHGHRKETVALHHGDDICGRGADRLPPPVPSSAPPSPSSSPPPSRAPSRWRCCSYFAFMSANTSVPSRAFLSDPQRGGLCSLRGVDMLSRLTPPLPSPPPRPKKILESDCESPGGGEEMGIEWHPTSHWLDPPPPWWVALSPKEDPGPDVRREQLGEVLHRVNHERLNVLLQ